MKFYENSVVMTQTEYNQARKNYMVKDGNSEVKVGFAHTYDGFQNLDIGNHFLKIYIQNEFGVIEPLLVDHDACVFMTQAEFDEDMNDKKKKAWVKDDIEYFDERPFLCMKDTTKVPPVYDGTWKAIIIQN